MWRIDWSLMGKLFVIGAPISGSFLLEYGMFAAAALIMGVIGTTALAAHQIALQIAAVMFMVPFGISMAATVRVGHAVGRGDAGETRRAGFAAIALGVGFMVLMTLLVALTREWLPLLFLGRDAQGAAETIRLAAMLLALGATFFIVDGVQTIAAGALRGLNDTRIPMLFAAVSFWAVGFVLSYSLGLTLGLGARGVWLGFTVGLAVYALLLVWRFHLLTQRRYLPALARAE
jgi:MATE family multidrug resistance protein